MTELIGAMCLAYDSTYSLKGHVSAMTEAARVIADALLSPLTTDEKQRFGSNYVRNCIAYGDVDALLKARRSLIEAKPKTPEERVTIKIISNRNELWIDSDYTGTNFVSSRDAEIYRLGLIEQLKQKEAK